MKLNSISIKIIILLIIIITFTMSASGIFDYINESISLNKNINGKLENLAPSIAVSISDHFWNLNMAAIKEIFNYQMNDAEIFGLRLLDSNEKISYEIKRDGKWNIIESPIEESDINKYYLDSSKAELISNNNVLGNVEIFITKQFLIKTIRAIILRTIIQIIVITFISTILLVLLLNKILLSHIKILTSKFKDIAEGEGDLTFQLDIKTKDEIGILSNYFNKFINNLNHVITQIKNISTDNKNISSNLSSNTEELSSTITEISSTMISMNKKIEYLNNELEKVKDAVNQVGSFVSKTGILVEDQSSSVIQSSTAIEEMIANINSLTNVTENKKNLAIELTDTAKKGEEGMKDMLLSINEITKSNEVISEMIKVINNVAGQINLLAMNAAIEAAHAGEYGKGFSVVSDEIRKLAETTGSNAKNISVSLKAVIESIKKTQNISTSTNEIIIQLINGITQISNSMNEMLYGMKEVNVGTEQISESLSSLISKTEEIKNSSKNLNTNFAEIDNSIKNVYDNANDNKNAISEITISINEITKAIYQLSDMSLKNANNAKSIDENVVRFKTK